MMMLLVAVCIAFMWVGQIVLFERNYINAAIDELETRLAPILEDIDELPLSYLSKSVNGKMLLFEPDGQLIEAYSYGHPLDLQSEEVAYIWAGDEGAKKTERLTRGETYTQIIRYDGQAFNYEIGIPVIHDGETLYAFMYHSLSEVHTVLNVNRQQLVALSVSLTIIAAILSILLSHRFVGPIFVIKRTVNQLASGNLDATPGLNRRDELGQLSDSVTELGVALKRVDVLRKEVIANVSHEMRSPLALIAGYAEMVRDISWKDDTRREEDLTLIIGEANRMSDMVKDIMDYSQFQAGYVQLNIARSNLCELAEHEVARAKPSALEHGIHIRQVFEHEYMPADVDALKICLVLRNLLSNAINHTADDGDIAVSLKRVDDGIRVAVVNPGDPIPEADRTVIWERYQRSQHQAGRRQGTGIGLNIVHTILEAHHIAYGVECEDGQTSFWFLASDKNNPHA